MNWILFLDLDGTFWDHLDVSETTPPFERISQYAIRDRNGETLTIQPGVLDFLNWIKKNGGLTSTCSWNKPEMALSALRKLGVENMFDYQRISPEPRKDLLIQDLMDKLEEKGVMIPQKNVFYLDDRDLHMPDIRRTLPDINFLHMWKVVSDYSEARDIIKRTLKL
jgi:magnesium-dependent phosphatase-1